MSRFEFGPQTPFVCFVLMFVGSWAHLCQGSNLGLEPFSFISFIYLIESLSRFVSNYYFVLICVK